MVLKLEEDEIGRFSSESDKNFILSAHDIWLFWITFPHLLSSLVAYT